MAFRLYWLIVGPFSALIRRQWIQTYRPTGRPQYGTATVDTKET